MDSSTQRNIRHVYTRRERKERGKGCYRAIDLGLLEHPPLVKRNDREVLLASNFETALTVRCGNWLRRRE